MNYIDENTSETAIIPSVEEDRSIEASREQQNKRKTSREDKSRLRSPGRHRAAPLVYCLLSALVMGCASIGVIEEERDRSGKFDGDWLLSLQFKKTTVVIEGSNTFWRIRCPEYGFNLPIQIDDGRVSVQGNTRGEAYVKGDGTFYANWQLPDTKTSQIADDKRMIFSGTLGDLKGDGTVVHTYDNPTQGCKGEFSAKKSS